jgi:hypothetical protein
VHSRKRTSFFGSVSLPLVLALLAVAPPGHCQSAESSSETKQLTAQQQEKLKESDRCGVGKGQGRQRIRRVPTANGMLTPATTAAAL